MSVARYVRGMARIYRGGATLEEVGERYGVSRERVRQVLAEWDRDFIPTIRADRAAKQRRSKQGWAQRNVENEFALRASHAIPCRMCGCWVMSRTSKDSPYITCSSECGEAWKILRYHLDDDHRCLVRKLNSRWAVEHPEYYTPSQVRTARRRLRGRWKGKENGCGSWFIRSEKVAELARRYGVDKPTVPVRLW